MIRLALQHIFVKTTGYITEVIMENTDKKDQPECRTYTVEEIAAMLGIGRTTAYQLVREQHFRSIRIGNTIRVLKLSFEDWLENSEQEF